LVAQTSGSPYLRIAARNVFGLVPAKRLATDLPPAPLTRVRIVGITTMLGDKRALLKVYLPAIPPEPAKEVSCILTTGQREGPIEVLEIDERVGSVTVNNAGTVMVLGLQQDGPRPQGLSLPPPPTPLSMQSAARR
jgi:hypothetical protein